MFNIPTHCKVTANEPQRCKNMPIARIWEISIDDMCKKLVVRVIVICVSRRLLGRVIIHVDGNLYNLS